MKIGLVLSGGGARGFAHLGVLHALDELGIRVDEISATSAGAMAGGFYFSGHKPREILKYVRSLRIYHWFGMNWKTPGIISMERIGGLLARVLPENFEDLDRPLTVCATDLLEGTSRYFNHGPLIPAICASSCIPLVFDPITIEGHTYIDGGVLNNFPTEPLETRSELIIGVHVNPMDKTNKQFGMRNILDRSMHLAIRSQLEDKIKICSVYIEPAGCMNVGIFDLKKADQLFDAGYQATMEKKSALLRLKK